MALTDLPTAQSTPQRGAVLEVATVIVTIADALGFRRQLERHPFGQVIGDRQQHAPPTLPDPSLRSPTGITRLGWTAIPSR